MFYSRYFAKAISAINWKNLWGGQWTICYGETTRSIFAIFNGKKLSFKYHHLDSTDNVIIHSDLTIKSKKILSSKEYFLFLKNSNIILDHDERQKIILKKFDSISKSKNFKNQFNKRLLEEVVNIVEDPNVLLINFDKEYLSIPEEIII